MNTTKTGAVAGAAVALLVVLSGCAGAQGLDSEPGSRQQSQLQSQQQFLEQSRQEAAAMRAELHAHDAVASVQSVAAAEAVRSAKQADARSADELRRQHELEHGASSERLR